MPSPESSFGASDARGLRYLSLDFFKVIVRFTLTDAASRPDAIRDESDDFRNWDVSAVAPTLGSLWRQGLFNNSPVAIARVIADHNANNRSVVAHARMCGEPIACAPLKPLTFAVDGGRRVLHIHVFFCHDTVTGTSYEAHVFTIDGHRQVV